MEKGAKRPRYPRNHRITRTYPRVWSGLDPLEGRVLLSAPPGAPFEPQTFEDQSSAAWTDANGAPVDKWNIASGGLNGSQFRMDGPFIPGGNATRYAAL